MDAIHIRLTDLGGALRLQGISTILGHPATSAPLVSGGDAPTFGPFGPPVQATWLDAGRNITVRVHAVGAIAVRLTKSDADWHTNPPSDLDDLVDRIADDLRPYLTDNYDASASEAWDVRVVRRFDEADARAWVQGDDEVLHRGDDSVLVGQDRAVICADDPADILDVLELARAELLEFRAYDAYLDRRLDLAYDRVHKLWGAGGWFKSARRTLREMSQVRVEVARLTDPLHGTDKLFGDRFTWRLHEHLQQRLRIRSWDNAVQHKVDVLEGMFHTVQEETHHRRALVLETMIVLLFVIDIWLIFFAPH